MSHHCENIHCRGHACGADEQRLNQLLEDILFLARADSFRSASRRFADLRLTLEQEMVDLEAGPFTELDQRDGRATRKLRASHLMLHLTLDALGAALSENALERVEKILPMLRTALGSHRRSEVQQLERLPGDGR